MWWTITGNYGNVLPIDWSKSYARQLHTEALHLEEKKDEEELNLDLSDDEELQAAFDMHSLIVSSLHHEPLFSADDVINEIEGIMKEADDFEEETAMNNRSSTSIELLQLKYKSDITPSNIEGKDTSALKSLSTVALNELYEELEGTVKELSETLIQQLALRDELEYEKELKNQFISLLLSLQKKRRELPISSSGIKVPGSKKVISPDGFGKYLTMSIPYNAERVGPPTNEELQIFIKIMKAMNEDSPVVPTLLTDYILKVVCPTNN
ncbi:DgyrCDS7915 [Dimorphilus gyrociliatus]|nr:DgyrCDS7915 [Dimorphilus gyrociliatus]